MCHVRTWNWSITKHSRIFPLLHRLSFVIEIFSSTKIVQRFVFIFPRNNRDRCFVFDVERIVERSNILCQYFQTNVYSRIFSLLNRPVFDNLRLRKFKRVNETFFLYYIYSLLFGNLRKWYTRFSFFLFGRISCSYLKSIWRESGVM